jgi:alpha-L-fucosidase
MQSLTNDPSRFSGGILLTLCLLVPPLVAPSPAVAQDELTYVEETDPIVRQKLEEWQDLKLGLLMHWGPYSQWGIVESWSLCSEDVGWCERSMDDYHEYKKAYEALQTTFNPTEFDPERWARAARDAGMKYVVFTTKHHDGFSMFDTRLTDYRITAPATPFGADPRADVTKGILDAFRQEGFMTGVYFSKPARTTGGPTSPPRIATPTTTSTGIQSAGSGSWISPTDRSMS